MRVKIQDWETDDNLLLLKTWGRKGLTDEEIAANMGVDRSTLYRWQKRSDIIRNTIKKARLEAIAKVEDALYEAAVGGDKTAMIFYLKNRDPKHWKDKWEQEITHNMGENVGVIEIPMAMEQPDE